MVPPKASMNSRSSRIRTAPTKRARTEVVLAISADGRAQAKATVVHQPPAASTTVTAIDDGDSISSGYDSLEESDSSFDGDAPRGMAPDGSEYLSYRRRRCSSAVDQIFHRSTNSSSSFGAPRTPKRSRGILARATNGRRNRAESSLTTLPTPLKSSPPPSNGHIGRSQSFNTNPTPQLPQFEDLDDVASEAETVVDEPIELPMDKGDADGDALTALKQLLAHSRTRASGGAGSSPETSRLARPSSALKRTYRTPNRSGRPGTAHDASSSSPIMSRTPAVPTPRRKPRRRPLADGGFHYRHHLGNASPTTVTDPDYDSDRAISDVDGDAIGETRCICGRQDDGGKTMVECDSCKYWLHLKCLGYGNRRTLPKVFICSYCIRVTPQTRHRTRS